MTLDNICNLLFKVTALKIKYNPFAKAFLDAKERYGCLLDYTCRIS